MSNKKMTDEIYKKMMSDLDIWDDYAILAIQNPSLKVRQECQKLLEKICTRHGVSVEEFSEYMEKFLPERSEGNFLN